MIHRGIPDTQQGGNRTAGESDQLVLQRNDPLLPYSDETFSGYQSASAQETRYEIGQQIQADIILCSFGKFLETIKIVLF